MVLSFIRQTLPSVGILCATHPIGEKDGRVLFRNVPMAGADALYGFLCGVNAGGTDVYMGLGSFKDLSDANGKFRKTADNVLYFRSVFIDIDVPKHAPDKATAVSNVLNWCTDTGVPAPSVVDSGNGVHFYWHADRDMLVEEWRALLFTFVKKLQPTVAIDVAVCNASPAPRMPGSVNYKNGVAKNGVILNVSPQYSFDYLVQCLGGLMTPPPPSAPSDSHSILGSFDTQPKSAKLVALNCRQIAECGLQTEPVWRAGLSVLRMCHFGREVSHAVSALDPRYSEEDTNIKLEMLADQQGSGMPTRCETFDMLRPGVCSTCPHWPKVMRGEIKTPLVLGIAGTLPQPLVSTPAPVYSAPAPQTNAAGICIPQVAHYMLSGPQIQTKDGTYELRTPYTTQDAHGNPCPGMIGTVWYKRSQSEDGTWTETPVYLSPDVMVPIHCSRQPDPTGNLVSSTVWRVYSRSTYSTYHDVTIPDSLLHSKEPVKVLAQYGVTVKETAHFSKMGECLRGFLMAAKSSMAPVDQPQHIGWISDDTFALGTDIFRSTGPGQVQVQTVPANPETYHITKHIYTDGDLDTWKRKYAVFGKEGLEHMGFASLVTWGAPLLKYTACRGFTVSMFSGGSGYGKSTLQTVCAGAWGNPRNLTLSQLGSSAGITMAAFMSAMSTLHSMPVFLDEISEIKDEDVSMLLYAISSGEERKRADTSGKMKHHSGQWHTICLASTNRSLRELLASGARSQHSAQLARLIELRIPVERPRSWEQDTMILDRDPNTHFGHAGRIFSEYMIANRHLLSDEIEAKRFKLTGRLQPRQDERFYYQAVASMFVGAELAGHAGLHNFDLSALEDYFIDVVLPDQRRTSDSSLLDFTGRLADFFADNLRSTLVVRNNRLPESVEAEIRYKIKVPAVGAPLHVRCEVENSRAFVSIAELQRWCTRNRISYESLITGLQENGLLLKATTKICLGKGVNELVTLQGTPVNAISVKVNPDIFTKGDEDYDEDQ